MALLSIASLCSARQPGIEIRPAETSGIRAVAGQVLTIGLHVTNRTLFPRRFKTDIDLPPRWRVVISEKRFDLPPSGEDLKLLSIFVPREASSGRYSVGYAVKDEDDTTVRASVAVDVLLSPVRHLELRLLESPRFVAAGGSFESLFRISNDGNVPGLVRLAIRATNGTAAPVDSPLFHLNPMESRDVAANVIVDASPAGRTQAYLEVSADYVEDTTVSARAACAIEVIPGMPPASSLHQEFPLQATLRATAGSNTPRAQIEIWGSGDLFEKDKDRLDLLIRTPDTQPGSFLGLRDEYRLSYHSKPVDAYLGDANFTLSPLTELGRYAFGGGGRATLEGMTVGGFHNENRFLPSDQREDAGFMSCHIAEGSDIGVNFVKKQAGTHSNTLSVRSTLRLLTDNDLDAEYGVGYGDRTSDDALALRLDGHQHWMAYDLQYVNAGTNYTGYYRDMNLTMASISIFPTSSLRLEGYVRDEDRNLNRDTLLGFAPRDRYYQVGVGHGDLVAAYYRVHQQEDQLPNPKYQRREDLVQLRLGYDFGFAGLLANIDLGATKDRILATSSPSQRYSLIANIRPTDCVSFGTSAEYARDQSIYSLESQERVSGSVNMSLDLGEGTRINASVNGSHISSSYPETNYLTDFVISHTFPFKHVIALRGRQTFYVPANGFQENACVLEYTVPLGVPIPRSAPGGQICGTITDERTGSAIANAILSANGAAALSNEDGQFCFPALTPGIYFLQLDLGSAGLHYLTSRPLPAEIVVREGEKVQIPIGIVRSASISGSVLVYDFDDQIPLDSISGQMHESGRLRDVLLELTNETELHRRLTDSRGRFSFTDLRPGRWTLRVIEDNPPSSHYFDTTVYKVEPPPAGTREITVRLLPRRRRIQIIDEGKTIEEVKPEEQTPGPCTIHSDARSGFVLDLTIRPTRQAAEEAARKAAEASGYPTTVTSIPANGHEAHYLVQLGPFQSRLDAEEACHLLQRSGLIK